MQKSKCYTVCIIFDVRNQINGITSIADNAFYGLEYLENVSIPSGESDIGDGAFAYCRALTSIPYRTVLPISVKVLLRYAPILQIFHFRKT